jgi:MoaA/NifB/PqqE/SkfB family radical SAM enzyme
MPNPKIFCNSPWFELHIYWDGSLGFCCHESHKIYPDELQSTYNVRNLSIKDWYNSEPMRQIRKSMFGDQAISICARCYHEEKHSSTSRRHRSNQKSVIFTRSAFEDSFRQSPNLDKFEYSQINHGDYDGMPIDVHIDLGNYCNLCCKMCRPQASSLIASQYVKWGLPDAGQYVGTDWTRDSVVWDRVLRELSSIANLKNVHFMGGETLITKRFEEFVDHMIDQGRTDICFSFVTNGTTFNEKLLTKLKQFQRVGIEVSIEALDARNSYQRQGTDQAVVMRNLQKYLDHCAGTCVTVTVRPAISALTIGSYHELLEFCFHNRIIVKSLLVTRPPHLDARILPDQIRQQYSHYYQRKRL